jgi:fructokinase
VKAIIFGEVLYDFFPDDHAVPGGAPFNVAWHLNAFDLPVEFVSRVGNDTNGQKLRELMKSAGMPVDSLQTDSTRPTGHVNITLGKGQPTYVIAEGVAYDAIEPAVVNQPCDILYHGTLALRSHQSAHALEQLRGQAKRVFMDANLRDPYWSRSTALELASKSDWLKVNADEFSILTETPYTKKTSLALLSELDLEGLLVTSGERGACVYTQESYQYANVVPKPVESIRDTVGAGDAFSAIFIFGLIHNWPMQAILARAQAFASSIISISGAISTDPEFYAPFKQAWLTENLIHDPD